MIKRHFLWLLFLAGLAFLFEGAGSPPISFSMSLKGSLSLHSKGMKPSTCPMKGNLPCCHNKAQISLCRTPLCDLCFQSTSLQEENESQILRVQAPLERIPITPVNYDTLVRRNTVSLFSSSHKDILFGPPVNRPLLI